MKRLWALPALLVLAAVAVARAQNGSMADPTTNAPSAGPVVMPSSPNVETPSAPDASQNSPDVSTPLGGASVAPDAVPSLGTPSPNAPGAQKDDIDDIRPPFFFLHSWAWLWLALLALALIALVVGLWIWFRPQRSLLPKTAYELALEKLEKAKALLDEENPEPYAVAVSETIRSYLSQRFQAPASRRTTDEFLRQMQEDPSTPLAVHRGLLREFLEACDLVKFAHYQPGRAELEQVQERAVTFVTATKPAEAGDMSPSPAAKSPSPALATTSGGRP